jgi:hypothetical protein
VEETLGEELIDSDPIPERLGLDIDEADSVGFIVDVREGNIDEDTIEDS